MNTTEALTTVRDALQIGPDGRAAIYLKGRPPIHSYFNDGIERIAEYGPSAAEFEEAEMLADYITEEVGPEVPIDETLRHRPWLDGVKPHLALDLGRIASAVTKTERLGRIDEDTLDLREFTTIFVAESLVTSVLLERMARARGGPYAANNAYASVYLSTEYIAELRRDHPEIKLAYFAHVVNDMARRKGDLRKMLGKIRDEKIPHSEYHYLRASKEPL
jgi:hypothetical protein